MAHDRGDVGGEGLGRAFAQALLPFAGFPQRAIGVGRLALFGGEEVQGGDAEGCAFAQKVAGGLRAGQADEDVKGPGRIDHRLPRDVEAQAVRAVGEEGGLAARAVDRADEEDIAGFHAENFADVHGTGIAGGEAGGVGGGFEEDEVHGNYFWKPNPSPARGWREPAFSMRQE